MIAYQEKEKYKTEHISTFPQIYLKKKDTSGTFLIGGYTDFKKIVDIFYHETVKENFKDNLDTFIKNNPQWNRKLLLRLIELVYHKKVKN